MKISGSPFPYHCPNLLQDANQIEFLQRAKIGKKPHLWGRLAFSKNLASILFNRQAPGEKRERKKKRDKAKGKRGNRIQITSSPPACPRNRCHRQAAWVKKSRCTGNAAGTRLSQKSVSTGMRGHTFTEPWPQARGLIRKTAATSTPEKENTYTPKSYYAPLWLQARAKHCRKNPQERRSSCNNSWRSICSQELSSHWLGLHA